MKNSSRMLFAAAATVFAATATAPAQAAAIATWNFNSLSSPPSSSGSPATYNDIASDIPTTDIAVMHFNGIAASTASRITGTGATPGYALQISNQVNDTKSLEFRLINATGFKNITLDFDWTDGNPASYYTEGFTNNTWDWSTDGSSWNAITGLTGVDPGSEGSWHHGFADLSSKTSLNNDSSIYFRLTMNGANDAADYLALDNVVISGTPVPLPAAAWLLLSGIGAVGAVARRRKVATAAAAG